MRDAYLDGEAGASVAARHGISESAFWRHVAENKWRRRDQAPPPPPFDPDRTILDEDARLAIIDRRICWALELGDAAQVLRWQRARDRVEGREERRRAAQDRDDRADRMRKHHEISALTTLARDIERVARAGLSHVQTETLRQKVEDELAGRESRESKKTDTGTPVLLDPAAPGLSRAERRRRLKYQAKHAAAAPP